MVNSENSKNITAVKMLSLGAGVQSSALLEMSCIGFLPHLDFAIFADTGWETPATYNHLAWLIQFAAEAGIPVYRVNNGNLRDDQKFAVIRGDKSKGERYAALPLYTSDGTILWDRYGRGRKKEGKIKRQCTREYKIEPIQKKIRELIGLKPRQRKVDIQVEQWFGISADEAGRMKGSKTKWIQNRYPLIYDLQYPFHRHDCLKWMAQHGFPEPPRSSCIGCPFHNDHEWRQMRETDSKSWDDAVEFDHMIRHRDKRKAEAYLHRSVVPLDQVDLQTKEEQGQENLFMNECEGMCGV